MNRKISVLGSTGFVGLNLVPFLKKENAVQEVSLRNKNWKADLRDSDVIINLVGKAHDHKGIATETDYFYANFHLVKEIFEVFQKSEARLLIHISSIAALEEYGRSKALDENDIENPQSFYGKSKRAAELFLLEQNLKTNKKIIILRPPMIHGAGDKGNLTLLFNIVKYRIPWPLSNFKNKRSFLSIDNFNYFTEAILKNRDTCNSGVYHICDDEPLETNTVIECMRLLSNRKSFNIKLTKSSVLWLAKIGDRVGFPLNTKRLNKMTSNLVLSNQKIKKTLKMDLLPLSAQEGLKKTIMSFLP
jgi:nucleoside-diphosphate-sugar epimerase